MKAGTCVETIKVETTKTRNEQDLPRTAGPAKQDPRGHARSDPDQGSGRRPCTENSPRTRRMIRLLEIEKMLTMKSRRRRKCFADASGLRTTQVRLSLMPLLKSFSKYSLPAWRRKK